MAPARPPGYWWWDCSHCACYSRCSYSQWLPGLTAFWARESRGAHEDLVNPSPCGGINVFLVTPARNLSFCPRSNRWPDLTDSTLLTHSFLLCQLHWLCISSHSLYYSLFPLLRPSPFLKFILYNIARVIFSETKDHTMPFLNVFSCRQEKIRTP